MTTSGGQATIVWSPRAKPRAAVSSTVSIVVDPSGRSETTLDAGDASSGIEGVSSSPVSDGTRNTRDVGRSHRFSKDVGVLVGRFPHLSAALRAMIRAVELIVDAYRDDPMHVAAVLGHRSPLPDQVMEEAKARDGIGVWDHRPE